MRLKYNSKKETGNLSYIEKEVRSLKREPLQKKLRNLPSETIKDEGDKLLPYLKKFSSMQFANYMRQHEREKEKLLYLLKIPKEEGDTVTYGEVANRIYTYLDGIQDLKNEKEWSVYTQMLELIAVPVLWKEEFVYHGYSMDPSYEKEDSDGNRIPFKERLIHLESPYSPGEYDITIFHMPVRRLSVGLYLLAQKYKNPAWIHFDTYLKELLNDAFLYSQSELYDAVKCAQEILTKEKLYGFFLYVFILPFVGLPS